MSWEDSGGRYGAWNSLVDHRKSLLVDTSRELDRLSPKPEQVYVMQPRTAKMNNTKRCDM